MNESNLWPLVEFREGFITLNFSWWDGAENHWLWADSDGMRCDYAAPWDDVRRLEHTLERLFRHGQEAITEDAYLAAYLGIWHYRDLEIQRQTKLEKGETLWAFLSQLVRRGW
jgi:hypothetical protein